MRRALLAACMVLVAACADQTPPITASGVATFHDQGLIFDYPASWRASHYDVVSSFNTLITYLATVDVGDPCVRAANSVSCGANYRLAPDTIVVTITGGGMPRFDILNAPPGARALVAGGLPAWVERLAADELVATADAGSRWTIARPGTIDNYVSIQADVKGPDIGPLLAQVDALVASLRYDPPAVPLETDPGAGERAATKALGILARDDPSWGCFLGRPGVRRMRISSMIASGRALAVPQIAKCTTKIEATRLQLWRLTLTVELPAPDPQDGNGEDIELWVNPDGTPGAMSGRTT